jgi:hypothetical protein
MARESSSVSAAINPRADVATGALGRIGRGRVFFGAGDESGLLDGEFRARDGEFDILRHHLHGLAVVLGDVVLGGEGLVTIARFAHEVAGKARGVEARAVLDRAGA